MLRGGQERSGFLDRSVIEWEVFNSQDISLSRSERSTLRRHQILRHDQRRGTWPAGGHRLPRLRDHAGNLLIRSRRADVLRARAKDAFQVDLVIVAALLMHAIVIDLSRDEQHRLRIAPAFGDAGERIRRPRAGCRANDAGLASDARVAVGRESAGLFVARKDGANAARMIAS